MLMSCIMNNFYSGTPSESLRFGDILQGYVIANLTIKRPLLQIDESTLNFDFKITLPDYCVVLTPCCSIEKSSIALCPLDHLINAFCKNDYFREDYTRINRRMNEQQAFTTEEWEKLKEEERANRLLKDPSFALLQYFIYAPHPLLKFYELRGIQTNYYMIDFKNTFKIKCDLIKNTKSIDSAILSSKILELSINSRHELREKISNYYHRIPEEDRIEM